MVAEAMRHPCVLPLKWRLLTMLIGDSRKLLLDCGCSSGELAQFLITKGFRVTGVEKDAATAAIARTEGLTVVVGDLADRNCWQRAGKGFEVVLFSDVIEHLEDPGQALEVAKAHIATGGVLIFSVPNIAYWKMRRDLMRGRWTYEEEGILDRTHRWFYTRKTFFGLLAEHGLEVDEWLPLPGWVSNLPRRRRLIHAALAAARPELFAINFLIRARCREPH